MTAHCVSDKIEGFTWQVCAGEGRQDAGVPQATET